MNKFWEKLIEEKTVVLCSSCEECEEVVKTLIKEVNDDMPFDRDIFYRGENICISFEKNCEGKIEWCYGDKKWYEGENHPIISFNDFIRKNLEYKKKNDGKLIVLVAPSSAGKDALQEILVEEKKFIPLVSHTNRPMRKNEVEGVNYYFISSEIAHEMLVDDKFIEHREYETINSEGEKQIWIYGISKKVIDDLDFDNHNYVVIVDFQGLKLLEEYMVTNGLREKMVSIFVKASSQTRLVRSLSREGNMTEGQVAEVLRRYNDDKEKVEPAISYCDITVTNEKKNDLERNVKIIEAITK